ncbi:type II toxin-antitoxin system VapC family toxin [Candidatus Planktophila dulcis]|uniref:type II toxin-antitoxin system VapC family toxin n=1 Tax=Candidatus Planktophila dulcis TaxID=1884914 RepID=UPI003BEF0EFF
MATIVLDTSVLIALLKSGDTHHQSAVKATSVRNEYLISAVTLGEALISAFRINEQSGRRRHQLIAKVVSQIVPIDEEIAIHAAQIRAEKNLSLADALISATSYKKKAQLWSCDRDLVKLHRGALQI